MKKSTTNLILIFVSTAILSIGVFSQSNAITFRGTLTDATTAQPTAFTYQGKLTDGGTPANGTYDFQFTLYDAANVNLGSAMGSLPVTNGIFTASIDGAAPLFTSSNPAVFLEIGVRLSGVGLFTTLAPRQPITSSPYSVKSLISASSESLSVTCVSCVADSQISSINAAKMTGVLGASQGGTGIGGSPPPANTFLRSNGAGWQATSISASDIPSNLSVAASGITGVLGTSQGGTGSGTQNFIDLTTNQAVAGNKTFSGTISGNGSGLTNLNGANLTSGSVNASQLGALSITSTALGDGAVLTNKIAGEAVTTGKLADGSVTMPKIVDGAVTTPKIADSSVTKPKLAFDPSVRYDTQLLAMGRWDLLQTSKTVAVGSQPVALAFDGTFIYVANVAGGTVTHIRANTGVVEGGPITVGSVPIALAFDGTFIYVANSLSNNITRIRASTGLVEGSPIAVAAQPRALINTGTFIYVACGSGNSVVRIVAATGMVDVTIPLFAATHALAFDGTWVFVTVFDGELGTEVRKINAATGVLQPGVIGMPGNPRLMAFDGTYVYTADDGGQVRRFSASTTFWDDGFLASISAPTALTFDGTFIYVASLTGVTGPVIRIRVSNGTIEGSPIPAGNNPSSMLFDGSFVWVALRNDNAVKRF